MDPMKLQVPVFRGLAMPVALAADVALAEAGVKVEVSAEAWAWLEAMAEASAGGHPILPGEDGKMLLWRLDV